MNRPNNMISRKEVQHIAGLARLGITPKEEEKFRKELSLILGYVDKLKKVDVSGVEPTSHPLQIENVMRKDGVIKRKAQLLEGFLKVKAILK